MFFFKKLRSLVSFEISLLYFAVTAVSGVGFVATYFETPFAFETPIAAKRVFLQSSKWWTRKSSLEHL